MLVKSKRFRRFLVSALSAIIGVVLFIAFMKSVQARKLNSMIDSISDYYYISCPNGNALYISECDNLKYTYELVRYSFDYI